MGPLEHLQPQPVMNLAHQVRFIRPITLRRMGGKDGLEAQ
jgi:hypothetical protein